MSGEKGEGVVAIKIARQVFQNLRECLSVAGRWRAARIGQTKPGFFKLPSTLPSLNSDSEFAEELAAYFRPRKVVPQRDAETSERQSRQSDVTRVRDLANAL